MPHPGGSLRLGDYELLRQSKSLADESGKPKAPTTWSWRITPARYRQWETMLVQRALAPDRGQIKRIFSCLRETRCLPVAAAK